MREDEEADIQDLEVGDLNDMESDASCHNAAVEDFFPFAIQNTMISLCNSLYHDMCKQRYPEHRIKRNVQTMQKHIINSHHRFHYCNIMK